VAAAHTLSSPAVSPQNGHTATAFPFSAAGH